MNNDIVNNIIPINWKQQTFYILEIKTVSELQVYRN